MRKISLLLAILFTGCVGPKFDPPLVITTRDIAQARWVESVIAKTPGLNGKFNVQPLAQSIVANIYTEISKEEASLIRENMKLMKSEMLRQFGQANTLVFKFKNIELTE
jgi:hypothetical protein